MKPNTTAEFTMTRHRYNKRLWLEGKRLTHNGFVKGAQYIAAFDKRTGTITLSLDKTGGRIVSGRKRKGQTKWTPIIDICCPEVADTIKDTLHIQATFYTGKIIIKAR